MKVVVKTLDSKNQELELPNEASVRQLKEKIAQDMSIPVDKQRLIFQGKVLKEGKLLSDYGDLEGKVIHLVQSAPPPEATQAEGGASAPPSASATPTVTSTPTHARSDVLFVSTMPVLPGSDIAQMTQHLVSNIVDSLNASGQHASVSAHAQMVDATTGHTHEHVVASATTGGMSMGGTGLGTNQGAGQRQQTAEQSEQERARRQLREIYQHMRSARRCLVYAKTILDSYEGVQVGGAQVAGGGGQVAGGGGQVAGEGGGETEEMSQGLPNATPPFSTMSGTTEEPVGTSELQPVGANLYADLLEEYDRLCVRTHPLSGQYIEMIRQDTALSGNSVVQRAQRLAQVIKDLHYYLGHTQTSLSRLHVCMNSEAPRVIRLVPPRRSELRRAMQHLRSFTVPPPELLFDLARGQLGRGQGATGGVQQQQHGGSTQAASSDAASNRPFQAIRFGPISFGAAFPLHDPQGGTLPGQEANASAATAGQAQVPGGNHGNEQASRQPGPPGGGAQANARTADFGQLLSSIIGNLMQGPQGGAQTSNMGGAPAAQQSTNVGAPVGTQPSSGPQGHGQQGLGGSQIMINFPLAPTFQVLSSLLQQGTSQVSPGQFNSSPGQSTISQPLLSMSGSGEEDTGSEEDSFELHLELDTPTVDPPTDLSDPMAQLTNAAMEDMLTGSSQTIADIIHGMREEMGMEEEDAADMSMVEHLLHVISSEMSVFDVMNVFRGIIQPLRSIQPSLRTFLRDRVLQGVEPTEEHCQRAVGAFLEGVVPSLASLLGLPPCVRSVDLPRTVHRVLSTIMSDAYRKVIVNYPTDEGFPAAMHTWATRSAALFGALLRHITDSEESYEVVARRLLGVLFPPSTPMPILLSCSATVLSEMRRLRDVVSHTPQELDSYVVRCDESGSAPPPPTAPPPSMPTPSHTCGATLAEGTPLTSLPPPSQLPLSSQPSGSVPEYPDTMPREWIPVMNADREAMEHMGPQKPYSDAYASSMPMKKRKMEDGKAEVSSLAELLTGSVEKAVQQTGATPTSGASLDSIMQEVSENHELLDAMGEEMHGAMRERLDRDPDFSPQKFPQAQKVYNLRK